MSMTNSFLPSRRNPREVAQQFQRTDPTLNPQLQQQAQRTMSPQIQPVFTSVPQQPMSVMERPFEDTEWVEQEQEQIAAERNRALRSWEGAVEAALQRQQPQTQQQLGAGYQQPAQQGQNVPNYDSDSDLSPGRQRILSGASQYADAPYQLGGRTATGIDCSGLVMSVYNQLGFDIRSHSVSGQARSIPGVKTDYRNLRPGDLVIWNDNSHIAIYAGDGMIWDSSRSKGTTLRKMWARPSQVYGLALRLPGDM